MVGPDWRQEEARRLWQFGLAAKLPQGGFGWLDRHGRLTPGHDRPLYVAGRLTHVYALAHLEGFAGADEMVEHGLASLRGPFRDAGHGGWFTLLGESEGISDDSKWAYAHAFVILGAATATTAGFDARGLLDEALTTVEEKFLADGDLVERWDREWRTPVAYRGANAAMHMLEALMAAAAVTGDRRWLEHGQRIAEPVLDAALAHDDRIVEHFDTQWQPLLDHNAERKDDPFHPYGATPGHGFEWSRLLLQLAHRLDAEQPDPGLVQASTALFERACADGWAVDGQPGFIYTVDWDGTPLIRQRLHWVAAEALAAATVREGLDLPVAAPVQEWWQFVEDHHRDLEDGSWHHELDPQNQPAATIRPGKADLYHAVQACLLPDKDVVGWPHG